MIKLKGVLVDASNNPVSGAKIILRSVKNGDVPTGIEATIISGDNGEYEADVIVGSYLCYIMIEDKETAMPGYVNVYEYSGCGTLQEYLYAPCDIDSRPMFLYLIEIALSETRALSESAKNSAEIAEKARDDAQSISDANTFRITDSDPDGTIAGIAGTESGEYFRVAQGVDSEDSFIYYVNDNGAATPVSQTIGYASVLRIDKDILSVERMLDSAKEVGGIVPLASDDNGNVPIWLDNGDFDARGVTDKFASKLDGRVVAKGLEDGDYKSTLTPLAKDDNGNVPIWLDNGDFDARGFGSRLKNEVKKINNDSFQPRESPLGSSLPISTDGRSLYGACALIGRIINGDNKQLKILFTGDSWTEYVAIPQSMLNLCKKDYGNSWSSYISVNGQFMLDGTTFIKSSGWTMYDASLKPNWPPVNGCGSDGQSATTSLQDQTMSATAYCDEINLLYQDLNGSFRYRVDGGDWSVVTGGSTGQSKILKTSFSNIGSHSIDIDTYGNSGIVGINGFYCPSKKIPGVEIIKSGNAGITGDGLDNFKDNIQQFSLMMKPDIMFFILGTNDFRNGRSIASFKDGIRNHINAWRSGNQNMGCVLIMPARCSATGTNPSSMYRDASAEVAFELGIEWYNFHDDWSSWAVMNSFGVWVDGLHLNDSGAAALAKTLNNRFISK